MPGGRDAATVAREGRAARVATGDGWALFALMRGGRRRGHTRRALAAAARRGLVITPAHLDRVARAIRATWSRDYRGDHACAAGLAGLAAAARRRGSPTLAHLADALGLLPGPPLLRALGYAGDVVARDRALQRRADADWEAALPDDDEDDAYPPRPRMRDVLDVVDLAPPWTDLTADERAALLVAVATATPGRRTA